MPSTYTLISSNVLSSSAASVTFSAIPSTYTDLVLKYSTRTDSAGTPYENDFIRFNGSTASNYSHTRLEGTGSAAASARTSNTSLINLFYDSTGATATSSTFNNNEIYIPSYTISQNKPISVFIANETNNSTAYLNVIAGLWRVTDAITSLTITSGANFVSGSSFYLYGIKNS